MKTLIYLIPAFVLITNGVSAQGNDIEKYIALKPSDIKAKTSEIQEYDVTMKWRNLDVVEGTKINCNVLKATFYVGMNNDSVKWENASLAQIDDFQQTQFEGTDLPALNHFSYKPQYNVSTDFLKEEFYKDIPLEQKYLARMLVMDEVQMIEQGWHLFDSLEYKKDFMPNFLNNFDIQYEHGLTFTSTYQKFVWSAITEHNNEICAVVKFESFFNPFTNSDNEIPIKGRSLFYGEMWISLEDKQVEYAIMVEDVVFKGSELIDMQREIVFNKVK
ncbi:hypothetical protein FACS1894207_3000 [Bacteroidia bacterium]|nr:hypothetical protein FACS1894207_3000 [Bacteroidia bacterium]